LIFDGCGLIACFSLWAKSSDGAFSRHSQSKLARFRDMAGHKAARKPGLHFRLRRGGNLLGSFSEQLSHAGAFRFIRTGIAGPLRLALDLPADPPRRALGTARLKITSIRRVFDFSWVYMGSTGRTLRYRVDPGLCLVYSRIFLGLSTVLHKDTFPREKPPVGFPRSPGPARHGFPPGHELHC
jgi:hypothetical protein